MKERPILFSDSMVCAIFLGAKTQTRRVVKDTALEWLAPDMFTPDFVASPDNGLCPYGVPGDLLWVREAWAPVDFMMGDGLEEPVAIGYRADLAALWHGSTMSAERPSALDTTHWNWGCVRWRPSIHMPRWASRLTLRVTSVRVERLQAITEEDAIAEGITGPHDVGYPAFHAPGDSKARYSRATAAFEALWDSLAAEGSRWSDDPWVWCVGFECAESAKGRR